MLYISNNYYSRFAQDTSSRHSDEQEVMSESHDPVRPHPPATPLSSSSSRRSSVTDSAVTATEGDGRERGVGGVVEWHAGTTPHDTTTVVRDVNHCGNNGSQIRHDEFFK